MRSIEYICLNSFLAGRDPPYDSECYITSNVSSDLPPVYVVVAPQDTLIPAKQSYELYKALLDKGVDVEIGEGKGAEHGFTEWNPKYWPEGAQWWTETILPSLKWAREKALA
jgi:acetyl esterase/lipase